MNKLKSTSINLNLVLLALYVLLIFFTPLIFSKDTNELYEFPKMFYVYLIGVTIFHLAGYRFLSKNNFSGPYKRPSIILSAFVLIYLLSTVFSSHFYTSLWGYYTRFNGGLVSVLFFFGIYWTGLQFINKKDTDTLVKFVILSAVPVSLYGIFQHFSSSGLFWEVSQVPRVFSTFGQPNWLAAYLGMLAPLVIYRILIKDSPRILYFVIYLLIFSCLWFTYSLSGLLGFLGGFLLLLRLNRHLLIPAKKSLVIVVALSLLIVVIRPGLFFTRVQDALQDLNIFASSQLTVIAQDADYQISDPGFIRKGLWEGTLRIPLSSAKNFFIGTGPETFPYEFPPYRSLSLNYSSEWDFIFNKPHNYYLEIFSNLGFLGLLAYLAVVVKSVRMKHPYLTPALASLFISSFFGWPTVVTSLLFWIFIMLMEVEYEKNI